MDLESGDLFSRRACEADDTPMLLEDRELPTRAWVCPTCGSRTP